MARLPRIKGLKEALAALGTIPIEVRDKIQKKAVAAGARTLQRIIRANITRQRLLDSGTLWATIKIQYVKQDKGTTSASVGSALSTWHPREFGSEKMAARPYLRPAIESGAPEIDEAVRVVLEKELVRLANKLRKGKR